MACETLTVPPGFPDLALAGDIPRSETTIMLHTLTPTTPAASISGAGLTVTTSVAGVALLAIGAWLLHRARKTAKKPERLLKIVTVMFLVASFLISGTLAGTLTSMLASVGGAGANTFGIGVAAFTSIVGLILLFELWHHRSSLKMWHVYLALLTPMFITAGGGGMVHTAFVALGGLFGHVSGPVAALFG